jgi:hypothetical protein
VGGIVPSEREGGKLRSKGWPDGLDLFRTADHLDAEASDPTVTPLPAPNYDTDGDRFELTAKGEAYLSGVAEPSLA